VSLQDLIASVVGVEERGGESGGDNGASRRQEGWKGGRAAVLKAFGIEDPEMQASAVETAQRVLGEVARGLAQRNAAR
jgi:hypothetical protein